MHMIKEGRSIHSIHVEYGINEDRLHVLWNQYQLQGKACLLKKKNIRADYTLKKKIVLDIEENHLTLHAASLKYGASPQRISVWLQQYRTGGLAALNSAKRRGRPLGMGKTENALLKKVRALVEERNARLREIGQGPSKN